MCQNHNRANEMKVGFPTVRQFGVELEGYVDTNLYGSHTTRGDNSCHWSIVDDGSLDDSHDECGNCEGCGRVNCDTCDGTERVDCEECSGGNVTCSDCEGGRVHCDTCNGDGHYDEDGEQISCADCGGEGWQDCDECGGDGEIECEYCDGRGRVDCDDCEYGRVDCPSCDGSGNDEDHCSRYGIEAVSEPLMHTEPIHLMYQYLDGYSWEVDSSAGLHIHVDANDFDNDDFDKMLMFTTGIEPIIYSMTSYYRFSGTSYCKPLTYCRNAVKTKLSGGNPNPYRYGRLFSDTRYMGLNYEAISKHGTIEFRYFYPQEDAETVEKYVELMTKAVDFVKHATMEQIIVIVKHLITNKDNFSTLSEIVKETLNLSYEPWDESGVHRRYNWFTLEEITSFEVARGLIAPITATIGQNTQVV